MIQEIKSFFLEDSHKLWSKNFGKSFFIIRAPSVVINVKKKKKCNYLSTFYSMSAKWFMS